MLRKLITVTIAAVSLNVAAMGPDVGVKVPEGITASELERLIARIANREITRRARRLRVRSAVNADSSISAGIANSAITANTANSAISAISAITAGSANVAGTASFADSANTAGSANTANFAASANPLRFANISANGTVRADRSKGFTQGNVVKGDLGAYCFTGLPNVKGGMATVSGLDQDSGTTTQFTLGGGPGCTPDVIPADFGPVQFGVTIRQVDSTGDFLSDEDFFFVLYE